MHRTGHQPEPSHTTHATTPRRPRPSFAVDRTGPDGKCASRDGAGPAERRRAAPPKRPSETKPGAGTPATGRYALAAGLQYVTVPYRNRVGHCTYRYIKYDIGPPNPLLYYMQSRSRASPHQLVLALEIAAHGTPHALHVVVDTQGHFTTWPVLRELRFVLEGPE